MKTEIITHRGLDSGKKDAFFESSFEAFNNHLSRGYSLEFDLCFCTDGIVIWHDKSLNRLTGGMDKRDFNDVSVEEVLNLEINNGRLCSLEELLQLIEASDSNVNALHLKGNYQTETYMDRLVKVLQNFPNIWNKLFIFDLRTASAQYLKNKLPNAQLAASVAHPYDIARFNDAVFQTMLSIDEVVKYQGLYNWIWLDEWDLADKDGGTKKLYLPQTFQQLRDAHFKIALVTPEIHGSSPGLLGSEAHPDGLDSDRMLMRFAEVAELQPNAICTDYPDLARQIVLKMAA